MKQLILFIATACAIAFTSCSGGVNKEKAAKLIDSYYSAPEDFSEGKAKDLLSIYENIRQKRIDLYPTAKGDNAEWSDEDNREYNALGELETELGRVLFIEMRETHPEINTKAEALFQEYNEKSYEAKQKLHNQK